MIAQYGRGSHVSGHSQARGYNDDDHDDDDDATCSARHAHKFQVVPHAVALRLRRSSEAKRRLAVAVDTEPPQARQHVLPATHARTHDG